MERVRILKSIFVEQTGLKYRQGSEAEVPKAIADRHVSTGHMEIIPEQKESLALEKKKTVK